MNILVLTSYYYTCDDNPLGSVHSLISALNLNNMNLYVTGKCNAMTNKNISVESYDIVSIGKMVDFIFVIYCDIPVSTTCENIDSEPFFSKLLQINRWDRTAYVDYYEYTWRNKYDIYEPYHHVFLHKKCKLYFKRECYDEHLKMGMIPLPLSYIPEKHINYKPEDKIYDVFCCFGQSYTGLRGQVVDMCNRLAAEGDIKVLVKNNITVQEYFEYIRKSWITIDAKGAGYINHRFLEIIGNRSMCFREKYPIVFHKDYIDVDGESLVMEYTNIRELEKEIKEWLVYPEEIEYVERKAHEHYLKYHTAEKIGEYIVKIITNTINSEKN